MKAGAATRIGRVGSAAVGPGANSRLGLAGQLLSQLKRFPAQII